MTSKIYISFILLYVVSARCYGYYDFDKKIQDAYVACINLDFEKSMRLLDEERTEKPGNDLPQLVKNYNYYLKAFISDDQKDFEIFKRNCFAAIELLESKKENESSPYHLYVQSEILIQLALVRVKFSENIGAATEIRKAYKLIHKNEILFPAFPLNSKVSGFLEIIIGAVPSGYNWLLKIAGVEGSTGAGLKRLVKLYSEINSGTYKCYQTEILFYLGNVSSSLSIPVNSEWFYADLKTQQDNPLIAYVYSNLLMKQGRNDEAFTAINSILNKKNSYPFYFLYYKRGMTLLRKLDMNAENDFNSFLKYYPGNNNIKSAYQKLAWLKLIQGDTIAYQKYNGFCKSKGASVIDEDNAALSEASAESVVNVYLLKSRLLFDGGYYNEALKQLTQRAITDFSSYHDKLEFTYRLARIMEMMNKQDKAIEYYKNTYQNGKLSHFYFAANSALMLGLIYEKNKQYNLSRDYFKKCLELNYDQYKNSIDQKAKAGLERINNAGK